MEFESSIASHRATPVFVEIWIIRDPQNFSNYISSNLTARFVRNEQRPQIVKELGESAASEHVSQSQSLSVITRRTRHLVRQPDVRLLSRNNWVTGNLTLIYLVVMATKKARSSAKAVVTRKINEIIALITDEGNVCWFVRVENEEHDKSRKQQHGFIREPPLREHMVRSEGSWELETYFMCATIYYQSTSLLL